MDRKPEGKDSLPRPKRNRPCRGSDCPVPQEGSPSRWGLRPWCELLPEPRLHLGTRRPSSALQEELAPGRHSCPRPQRDGVGSHYGGQAPRPCTATPERLVVSPGGHRRVSGREPLVSVRFARWDSQARLGPRSGARSVPAAPLPLTSAALHAGFPVQSPHKVHTPGVHLWVDTPLDTPWCPHPVPGRDSGWGALGGP